MTATGAELRTRALRVAVEEAAGEAKSTVVERLLEALRALHAAADALRTLRSALRDLADDLELERSDASLDRRAGKLCDELAAAFNELDETQHRFLTLIDRHVPNDKREALRSAVIPTLDPAGVSLRALLFQFREGFVTRLSGARVLAKSVKGVSPRTLIAAAALYEAPHCSVDAVGAANVEHMVSVFECVLQTARERSGNALKRAEVDQLFLDTIATDVRGKGRSSKELADFALVPMKTLRGRSLGASGAELWSHALIRDLDNHWPKGVQKSGAVRRVLRRSIESRTRPSTDEVRSDVKAAQTAGKLNAEQAKLARNVWKSAMEKAPFSTSVYLRDFQAGTLMHGIGHLDDIVGLVVRAGGNRGVVRRVAECQLGHHMAGFVAHGFSEIDAIPDFEAIAAAGYIRTSSARKLETLYREAIALAARWRPKLNAASARSEGPALTHRERAEYARDAIGLRGAIEKLPQPVRWQLTNDDAGQFTPVGLPKWLNMFRALPPAPKSTGELIRAVYDRAHQPYKEENEARGSGDGFAEHSAIAATRLGLELAGAELQLDHSVLLGEAKPKAMDAAARVVRAALDAPDGEAHEVVDWFARRPAAHYREAREGEPAFRALAVRLRHDVHARSRYRDERGDAKVTDEEIVEWFRTRAPDPLLAARIAAAEEL